MKNASATPVLVLGCLSLMAATAYPWGYATHAHIADRLNRPANGENWDAIYAAMAPDMFNAWFDFELQTILVLATHEGFDNVWNAAQTDAGKRLAYGFISHNDLWGADFTAHHNGRTQGARIGYVVAKAQQLADMEDGPLFLLGFPEELRIELCHYIVEFEVDILMKRLDPAIGYKIMLAAENRNNEFPGLLAAAYPDYAWLFGPAEALFQQSMMSYGELLTLDEDEAMAAVAIYLAGLASVYPGMPPLDPELLVPMIGWYLAAARDVCQDNYEGEINATAGSVNRELSARGIRSP